MSKHAQVKSRRPRLLRGTGLVLVVATVNSCSSQLPEPTLSSEVTADCASVDAGDFFFPAGTLAGEPVQDKVNREAATRYLRAMAAPPLSCGSGPAEGYRLIWIPPFPEQQPAAVVFLFRQSRSWRLSSVQFESLIGAFPSDRNATRGRWKVAKRVEREMSTDESEHVLAALKSAQFWTTRAPADGARWILEGRREMTYRVVTFGSLTQPLASSAGTVEAFRRVFQVFFDAASIERPSALGE